MGNATGSRRTAWRAMLATLSDAGTELARDYDDEGMSDEQRTRLLAAWQAVSDARVALMALLYPASQSETERTSE